MIELNKIKITIGIPIYNVQEYLEQCLSSIVSQTHEHLEILCIDDCSPDQSVNIVRKFMQTDNRIRLIAHETNLGLGPARNTAIKASTADYIGFVDSDDWIAPTMYETMLKVIVEENADIVQCSADRIKNGRSIGAYPRSDGMREENLLYSMFGDKPTIVGAAWNKLYRRSLFINNDIFFPATIFEDVATTPRLLYYSRKVISIKDNLLFYRFRDNSIVNSTDLNMIVKRVEGLFNSAEILYEFIREREGHSLEFIINFRKYLITQFKSQIGTVGKLSAAETAILSSKFEEILTSGDDYIRYFFPEGKNLLNIVTKE